MQPQQISNVAEQEAPEQSINYEIDNKLFVVTPVYKKDSDTTLADVLLRLMQNDLNTS